MYLDDPLTCRAVGIWSGDRKIFVCPEDEIGFDEVAPACCCYALMLANSILGRSVYNLVDV